MDDFTNAEFDYVPFPSDTSKRGLGVSVEGRVYQCADPLDDAVLMKFIIKNESVRDLPRCNAGFHSDAHIGGPLDFADDLITCISPATVSLFLR